MPSLSDRPLPSLNILIADPSEHMASLVAGMLRSLKIRNFREVMDTHAAMNELQHGAYDVLVLDDGFKEPDSIAFTAALRAAADCPRRDIPIIMMSSLPDAARIAEARDAGVTEFLRKPFAANHMESRLNSIMKAPRQFITAPSYAGPGRRRHRDEYAGAERRAPWPMPDKAANDA